MKHLGKPGLYRTVADLYCIKFLKFKCEICTYTRCILKPFEPSLRCRFLCRLYSRYKICRAQLECGCGFRSFWNWSECDECLHGKREDYITIVLCCTVHRKARFTLARVPRSICDTFVTRKLSVCLRVVSFSVHITLKRGDTTRLTTSLTPTLHVKMVLQIPLTSP